MLDIERWPRGATLAYSIVYENPFESMLRQSVPAHDEFMIPACVSVFAGQIGEMHYEPGSPYHMILRHLDRDELEGLVGKGWSVCSKGMDGRGLRGDLQRQMAESRPRIEDAIGRRVSLFLAMSGEVEMVHAGAFAAQSGYLGMFSLLDHLNLPEHDLFCLGRIPLAEEGPRPRRRQFDPYDRLMLARDNGAWVVDSVSRVGHELTLPEREVTVGSLVRRFQKVREVGGEQVWCAAPDEVVDYILTRRATRVMPGKGGAEGSEYVVSVRGLDPAVRRRRLTFRASGLKDDVDPMRVVKNLTERVDVSAVRVEKDFMLFDVEVMDGLRLELPDV